MTLVAADVVVVRDQHQAWAGRNGFGAGWLSERAQDPENCDVCGEDAEADGGEYSEAEDDRHKKRDHGRKVLVFNLFELATSVSLQSFSPESSIYLR